MKAPTLHVNGTSFDALHEALATAASAIDAALSAVHETAPNGRDYYLQGDHVFKEAGSEHGARVDKLREVLAEIETLHEDLVAQHDVREATKARQKAPSSP